MVLKALMKSENMILTVPIPYISIRPLQQIEDSFIDHHFLLLVRELREPRVQRSLSKNHSVVFIISGIVVIGWDLQGLE